jgi:hypothetical protein
VPATATPVFFSSDDFESALRRSRENGGCLRMIAATSPQNVLAAALRQIRQGTFRNTAALSTWLYAIINGNHSQSGLALKVRQPIRAGFEGTLGVVRDSIRAEFQPT